LPALAIFLILIVLVDAFETVILPRRITRHVRLPRVMYMTTWPVWSFLPRRMKPSRLRENILSWYGPITMILLLTLWAAGLVAAFGTLYWSMGSNLVTSQSHQGGFFIDLYMSGTTFFTLGMGDVVPPNALTRTVTVIEAGLGFGFLAIVIGYLPVIYNAFSKRETQITMLDGRAGSPPSAGEILGRLGRAGSLPRLHQFLADWELTGAEMLETHISYPVLVFYRSQHANQSWVGSLTAVLDTCALVMAGIVEVDPWQAQLTFAMLRHTLVNLALIVHREPIAFDYDRLPSVELESLCAYLRASGANSLRTPEAEARLRQLRAMYEPFVNVLSQHLVSEVVPWHHDGPVQDNWRTTAFVSAQ
jgi:Ion channel